MRRKVAKWLIGGFVSGLTIASYLVLFYTHLFSPLAVSYINRVLLADSDLQFQGKMIGSIMGKATGFADLRLQSTSTTDTIFAAERVLLNTWTAELENNLLAVDQVELYNYHFDTRALSNMQTSNGSGSSISININNLYANPGTIIVGQSDSVSILYLDQINAKAWIIDGHMGSEFSLLAERSFVPGFKSVQISGLVGRSSNGVIQFEDLSIYDDASYLSLNGSLDGSRLSTRFQGDELTLEQMSEFIELPERFSQGLLDLDIMIQHDLSSQSSDLTGNGSLKLEGIEYPFTVNKLTTNGPELSTDILIGTEFNHVRFAFDQNEAGEIKGEAELFRPDLNPLIPDERIQVIEPIGTIQFSGSTQGYRIDTRIESFSVNDIPFKSLLGQMQIDQDGTVLIQSGSISQEENHIGFDGSISEDQLDLFGRVYVSNFNFLNELNPREVLKGTLISDFVLQGDPRSPRITGDLMPADFGIGDIFRINGTAKYDLNLVNGIWEGDIALQGKEGLFMDDSLLAYDFLTNFSDQQIEIEELHVQGTNNLISLSGLIDNNSAAIHKLNVIIDDDQIKLIDSVDIVRSQDSTFHLPPSLLTFNLAGISAEGTFHPEKGLDIHTEYELLNLGDFTRFARLNIPFSGIATGSTNISGSFSDPLFRSEFTLLNGNTIGYATDTAWVDLTLRSDATISHRIDARKAGGELTLIGQLPWGYRVSREAMRDATQNFSIQFENYRLRDIKLTEVVGQPISGRATGNVTYRGTPINTKMDADLHLRTAKFDTLDFNTVYANFQYEDNLWTFDSLSAISNWGYGNGVGTMPISLDLIADDRTSIFDREINMDFHFELNQMPFLTSYISALDIIDGDIAADLSFSGPTRSPIRNGKVRAHNGNIQISIMGNPITDVHSELTLVDNTMTIDHFSGKMLFTEGSALNIQGVVGRATSLIGDLIGIDAATTYAGNVGLTGNIDFTSFFQPKFDVAITGNEVYYRSADGLIEAIADADMNFTGRDTLDVNGILPVKRAVYYDNFTSGAAYHEEIGGIDSSMFRYSLQTIFPSDLLISNDQLEAEFEGELWLLDYGDGQMHFSGTLSAKEGGKFYYLGNELDIVEGEITFHSVDFNPTIDIIAQVYIQQASEEQLIELTLTGDLLEPELIIDPGTSQLTQNDILTYLTLNQTFVEASFEGGSALNPVETYSELLVEKQISKIGREITGLDIINISGVDLSGLRGDFASDTLGTADEVPRFEVGQRLSKNLKVTYESALQPTGGKTDYDFGLEYQINRNVSVTSKVNQDDEVELNWRFKFTY